MNVGVNQTRQQQSTAEIDPLAGVAGLTHGGNDAVHDRHRLFENLMGEDVDHPAAVQSEVRQCVAPSYLQYSRSIHAG